MKNGRLVLQPPLDAAPLSRTTLIERLGACGLIGRPYPEFADAWLVGENFLRLIGFLGCSPHLLLEPPTDGGVDFCHLRLRGPYPHPRLLAGANSRAPRCPRCGSVLGCWRKLQAAWSVGLTDQPIVCTSCGEASAPEQLNWRRNAGIGALFVEVWGIYPEEAIPQPTLLHALGGSAGGWRHFYLMD